ncbi:MAG: methyltransferase family protein [Acidobacteriaceae bacterium]
MQSRTFQGDRSAGATPAMMLLNADVPVAVIPTAAQLYRAEWRDPQLLLPRMLFTISPTGESPMPASGTSPTPASDRWPIAAASLLVGAAFFSLWFWLLPQWLGFRVETAGAARWRWLAAIPSEIGFAVAIRCVWDFGWTGHGTPAPIAPPQRLVIVGFYRYVRNPMYVGFASGWIGLWIVFGHANWTVITIVALVALGVHLFVVFYEEPTLRKKFGADYEEYCRNVNRWLPRLRPWIPT